MIQKIQDLLPEEILPGLLEMARWPEKWLAIEPDDDSRYIVNITRQPHPGVTYWIKMTRLAGGTVRPMDMCGLLAMTEFLRGGPKIVRPTPEQAESLSHVDVNLSLHDFSAPFPALVVETPGNPTYECVLVYRHSPDVLVMDAISNRRNLGNDLLGIVRHHDDRSIEDYLSVCEDAELEGSDTIEHAKAAERLALNMCLLLTNHGHKVGPAFPKALAEDQRLSKRDDESGRKARQRVATALQRVEFAQDVIVRRAVPRGECDPTGATVKPHWVRGHWKMQPWGPRNTLRRRTLIAPYLVHQELVADRTSMSAVYRDYRTTKGTPE